VGDEVDVLHTVFSPLSVVGRLCGTEPRLIELASEDPAATHSAIAAATETLAEYCVAALETGAAGIFYAPLSWASHDVCSEDFYREFGRPYDLQILAGIRAAEFNVLHVCRNHNMIDLLLDYPVAAVNWADRGQGNPSLAAVKGRTAMAVMGGIDQTGLATMSAEETATQATDALTAGPDRLLLTAGCSIPPATTDANRASVVAAARG
ncbi:MAG: uroporphyrinogen decarboxylase family protein, partial [Dehalococcoidia bacterium]|nr:uroporphyrinogen decarboxylase family protein [Dehalococcoidia bacterium]